MTKLDGWLDQHHAAFTAIRRDIHSHPELGLEEHRTAKLVADKLREWGVEVTENVGQTGVVGVIRGKQPGGRAIGSGAVGAVRGPGVSGTGGRCRGSSTPLPASVTSPLLPRTPLAGTSGETVGNSP